MDVVNVLQHLKALYVCHAVKLPKLQKKTIHKLGDGTLTPTCCFLQALSGFKAFDKIQQDGFVLNFMQLAQLLLDQIQVVQLIFIVDHEEGLVEYSVTVET